MALHQSIPIIEGFFHLTYIHNPGAAFGMLPHQRELFITISAATVAGILYFTWRSRPGTGLLPYALGMVLGGALGNLVDRIRYGTVVDFLDFFWRSWHFPVFNLADTFITIGVTLLILQSLWEERQRGESA